MNKALVIRYALVVIAVPIIHLVVYILFPGNWILAISASMAFFVAFLPASNGTNSGTAPESSNLITKELQEMDTEGSELHSMLGDVFNTMAKNAATNDLYSSEITDTGASYKDSRDNSRSEATELTSCLSGADKIPEKLKKQLKRIDNRFPLDNISLEDDNSFSVRLEVDPDGILHYNFQEREGNSGDTSLIGGVK
ncbi:MAG: hypothetical protein ACFFD4_36215 [Candidatus Odinarchaeota archaeon]